MITIEEWRGALAQAVKENNDEGLTMVELTKVLGRETQAITRRFRALEEQGYTIPVGYRTTTTRVGGQFRTPVYGVPYKEKHGKAKSR